MPESRSGIVKSISPGSTDGLNSKEMNCLTISGGSGPVPAGNRPSREITSAHFIESLTEAPAFGGCNYTGPIDGTFKRDQAKDSAIAFLNQL